MSVFRRNRPSELVGSALGRSFFVKVLIVGTGSAWMEPADGLFPLSVSMPHPAAIKTAVCRRMII